MKVKIVPLIVFVAGFGYGVTLCGDYTTSLVIFILSGYILPDAFQKEKK